MRWKGVVWALPIVLLAQSPALAKMHVDSPPGVRSFAFILIWIALMTRLFQRSYGAGRLSLAFGVGTVATAVVLGEYVDAVLHALLNVGPADPLPLAWVIPCVCVVSAVAQGGGAVWAGRLQGARPIGFVQAMRGLPFWGLVAVPAVYIVLKELLFK